VLFDRAMHSSAVATPSVESRLCDPSVLACTFAEATSTSRNHSVSTQCCSVRAVCRLVMPLVPAALLTAAIVSAFRSFLPWSEMFPLASGVILGYVQYDCTHYFMHHGVFKGHPWFEPLRESHMDHHYREHSTGYGITTSFFDFVFRTWNAVQCDWLRRATAGGVKLQ
jgi:hypothetical protein